MAAAAARSSLLRQAVRATAPSTPRIMQSQLQSGFAKQTPLKSVGVAAFHASCRRQILPPLPQVINGTANDAAPIPEPHPTHGSYHWTFERLVSAAILPVTIAPFTGASMHPVLDATLCGLIIIHSHIGFQACIIDYFPGKRVPKTRTGLEWLLRIATLGVAVGLYEFETNDVGLTEGIRRVWKA